METSNRLPDTFRNARYARNATLTKGGALIVAGALRLAIACARRAARLQEWEAERVVTQSFETHVTGEGRASFKSRKKISDQGIDERLLGNARTFAPTNA